MTAVREATSRQDVRALFAGPGALRALGSAGSGRVEHVSRHGAYIRFRRDGPALGARPGLRDEWLLVADPAVPFGPLSLVVDDFARLGASPGTPASRVDDTLFVGDRVVSMARTRERRCAAAPPRAPARAVAAAAAAALAALAPVALLEPGLAALAGGDTAKAVRLLAGLGEGLTPAGDDVLAGHAAWRHAAGAAPLPIWLAADRSSPLGLAYLRCAARGELPDAAARMLAAIRCGSVRKVDAALAGVTRWGATSGAALVWGMAASAG